jgi:hypothetical protein
MLSHPCRASLPQNSAWSASDSSIEMLEENGWHSEVGNVHPK